MLSTVSSGFLFLLLCLVLVPMIMPAAQAHGDAADTLHLKEVELIGGLQNAASMAYRGDGELIIAESGSDVISAYQISFDQADQSVSDGDEQTEAEAADDAVSEEHTLPDLDKPESLSLILDTELLVVSSGSQQVHWLDYDFGYVRSLAVPSWALGEMIFSPSDVTTNEIGEVYVLDRRNRTVFHFNANGSYLQHFQLSDIEKPMRLVYFDESLFVTDQDSGSVIVMTDTGRELARIGTFPELERVRVEARRIWILSGSVLHLFDISGRHLGNWQIDNTGKKLQDIAVIEDRVFLLTSGSLYYSEFSK